MSLIAAVAIVVASATARRDALGAQSCAEGRADVAFLIGGSVRGMVLDHVSKGLKTNVLDWMAERCVNVHPIMLLSIADVSGWRDRSAMFPKVYPHVLQRALDVIRPVAVSFYTASAYDLDTKDPWGQHCAARGFKVKKDDYFSPATTYAQFDLSKRLLCMARKVEQEKNIHFSWFVRGRPEYFWYAPPPVDFARTLWDGRDTNHDTDAVQPTLIFDEDWYWKYNDAFYVVHSSRANASWGQGTDVLKSVACVSPRSQMSPEASIFHVADYAHCNVRRGISLGHSAWPDRDGMGVHWCHGISEGNTTMINACNAANKISTEANAKYRERAKDWLEKRAAAAAAEAEAAGSAAAKPAPPERPAARGPTC